MPAQWQELPLRTRLEIQAGRKAIGADEVKRVTIVRWADGGEKWLRQTFEGKPIEFSTSWDLAAGTITLKVYKVVEHDASATIHHELLFEETCPAENFVTQITATKIMMVCG